MTDKPLSETLYPFLDAHERSILEEAIRELKKEIFYQIEMAIQSGYINDELFYPYKDLCSDPIDKIFGELK